MASDPFDFSDVFTELENGIDKYMRDPETRKDLSMYCADSTWDLVYDKYVPTQYDSPGYPVSRRYDAGGLADWHNYEVDNPKKMTLFVSNETKGNSHWVFSEGWDSGYINDSIEEGIWYHWRNSEIFNRRIPRPFMEEACEKFTDNVLMPEIHNRFFND